MSEFIHESSFESGGMGRVEIDALAGQGLDVSINHFGVLVMPNTVEGGQRLWRDIESLKHHLALAQRAINDHLGRKITGDGS